MKKFLLQQGWVSYRRRGDKYYFNAGGCVHKTEINPTLTALAGALGGWKPHSCQPGFKPHLAKRQTIPKRKGEVCIDKNERGHFECWERDGCGHGHHALFSTQPTMKEAIAEVRRAYGKSGLKKVSVSETQARFTVYG